MTPAGVSDAAGSGAPLTAAAPDVFVNVSLFSWPAVLAAFVALLVVAQHRLVAKKRATLDFILTQQSDDFIQNEQAFLNLAESGELKSVLNAKGSAQIQTKQKVQSYMNHWELLAVSIRGNIFDEDICKFMIGDKVCDRWDKASELIQELRRIKGGESSSDDEFFEHFENLARNWKRNSKVPPETVLRKILKLIQEITRF